jgi:L-ascorbate metabolism protein UlaG (beta-lactamase superfamily)
MAADSILAPPPTAAADASLQFVGHSTLFVELDGTRLVTDPVLREWTAGLVHRSPPSQSVVAQRVDAALISHLHHDHLDMGSLRLLPPGFQVIIARRGGDLLVRHGFPNTLELSAGESTTVGNVRVLATRADHKGQRIAGPTAETLGFIIEGSLRIYFAGDTEVFEEMTDLRPIDIALLPVAGWGPVLGPGHMNPERAVQALRLLQPRLAIPIHWGTLAPFGLHKGSWSYLTRPPREFATIANREAPEVDVRILQPGDTLSINRGSPSSPHEWQVRLASS